MTNYREGFAFLIGFLVLSAILFLTLHCKWRWTDIRFESVRVESVEQLEIIRTTPGWSVNLTKFDLPIKDSDEISAILQLMKRNKQDFSGHIIRIWDAYLHFKFVDGKSLWIEVVQTREHGFIMTFCPRCFGIKYQVRNDFLGEYLESIVNYRGPQK